MCVVPVFEYLYFFLLLLQRTSVESNIKIKTNLEVFLNEYEN